MMTLTRFENLFDSGYLDENYAEYILENGNSYERVICNGDQLTDAMENMYLFQEFKEYLINQ